MQRKFRHEKNLHFLVGALETNKVTREGYKDVDVLQRLKEHVIISPHHHQLMRSVGNEILEDCTVGLSFEILWPIDVDKVEFFGLTRAHIGAPSGCVGESNAAASMLAGPSVGMVRDLLCPPTAEGNCTEGITCLNINYRL